MSTEDQTPAPQPNFPQVPTPTPIAPVQIQSLSGNSGVVPIAPVSSAVPEVILSAQLEPEDYRPGPVIHIEPPPKENLIKSYWRKAGGGSFMVSLLIHVAILGVAYYVVETIVHEEKVDFLPGGGSKSGQQADQQLSQRVQTKRRSAVAKSTPVRRVVSTSATAAISLPDVPLDSVDMPEMSSMLGGGTMGGGGFGSGGAGGGFGKGMGVGGQAGFVSLPASMKSRCGIAERLAKLRDSGGNAECEKAVTRSLEYLKSKQNADGSWGTSHKGAMTGFALLCFLGRCETPDSLYYGDSVMRGILYLVELGAKNEHGLFTTKPEQISGAYEHGIATYALGEMYTLARMGGKPLPGMREAFEKGVETIIKAQNANGSWQYYTKALVEKNAMPGNDLSVTGWQYQALKAAIHTSLKIPNLHSSANKAVDYIETRQTKDGGIGGTDREKSYNQWSLTGAGVLGIQTLGKGKSATIRKAIGFSHDLFVKEPPVWEKNGNMYNWYYYAQAFFQHGGKEWEYWNQKVLPQIISNQNANGTWKRLGDESHGAGGDAELYRVALCTLTLEVYYRYLKVADKESNSIFDR